MKNEKCSILDAQYFETLQLIEWQKLVRDLRIWVCIFSSA